ncbi:fumarylacetoacetate hydrolase family protein [Methylomonas sp. SURF-2]|uniref:Fumarylacetoacetate hydrolase family protein n=1 Tax=Methylomonas subterranea TaxID=2952225 RepID=A0ABT1TFJ9_9GAMM|nr:fumarylacetoacetate hydrolase family protein [Methylomonas sp. SURF-2]MCQ8104079.1 fumarylacetoacetate hydrolase family protein [Methylomonas sp. SURF-2]
MKLVTCIHNGQRQIGAVVGESVVLATGHIPHADSMPDFLASGASGLAAMRELIASGRHLINLTDIQLLAPIPRPGKFLGIGLNYADHISETGRDKPEYPTFFTKQASCVIGHGAAIHCPKVSEKVDYEGELGFVIGKRCRHVSVDKAHEVIAGFTICNDVTVRDWQQRTPTWTLGKSFDTHGPMGPWLVTADEIADPHNLTLKTWVDDELRQNANTGEMLFNCYEMIAYLTQAMTLEPGDVISTGTPAGVGVKMKPRGYLKAGQSVRIEIEGIGALINPVIAEPNEFLADNPR